MSEPVPLPIANGFYLSDSLPISAQECVNWYVNIPQAPALNEENLFGTPGTTQLATTGLLADQINRGAETLDEAPYEVNGGNLYRLESDFTLTDLGVIEGTGRVSMAENGTQLMILVPGGKGYIFTVAGGLVEIVAAGFTANGAPQHVKYVDGFFMCTTDQKLFIISALNDGTNWNSLDRQGAESDPDKVVALIIHNNQPVIAGSTTLEFFQNIASGADFPFRRTGLFIKRGVKAPFSLINHDNTFMFIGGGENESPAIWKMVGNTLEKISTTAIDSILQKFTEDEISTAFAWSYAQKGAYFVGFSLPTTTLVLDTITNRWAERKSQITDAKGATQTVRCRINSIVTAYGKVIVGDSQDGRIGSLDPSVFTEYDRNIIRPVSTQPFQNNMKPVFVPHLELTTESGVGNNAKEDPVITLEISKDGGKTYGKPRTRRLGKKGEYERRQIWRRNGRIPRFAIFRFVHSAPVKPVIIQLTMGVPE